MVFNDLILKDFLFYSAEKPQEKLQLLLNIIILCWWLPHK